MNRRPPGLQLSTCIQGFLQYKAAEGLSFLLAPSPSSQQPLRVTFPRC